MIQGHVSWFLYLTDVATRVLLDQLDCFVIDICFFHSICVKDDTTICRAMTFWKTTNLKTKVKHFVNLYICERFEPRARLLEGRLALT